MKTIEVTEEELELIIRRRQERSDEYHEAMFERNYKGGNWFFEHPENKKKPQQVSGSSAGSFNGAFRSGQGSRTPRKI